MGSLGALVFLVHIEVGKGMEYSLKGPGEGGARNTKKVVRYG